MSRRMSYRGALINRRGSFEDELIDGARLNRVSVSFKLLSSSGCRPSRVGRPKRNTMYLMLDGKLNGVAGRQLCCFGAGNEGTDCGLN